LARKQQAGFRVGGFEKAGYSMYFFGQNIFYALIALNIQTMFSDVGITVTSIALILLITKVWDAVNDPLFGIIIDKVHFKSGGRFLPWLRISLPFIAISSIFLFMLPASATPGIKIFWAILGYIAWDVSYTVCDVPIFVLPTSMTDNIKERTGILAVGRYFGTLGIILSILALPLVQSRLGWMWTGVVYTVIATAFMIPACLKIKERHIVRPEKGVTLKEMAQYVTGNKYLLIFYIGMLLSQMTNFSMTLLIFFPRYNLGNQELGTFISMATALPMFVVGVFIPAIVKRVDKFHVFIYANIAIIIISVIRYFVGYENLIVLFTLLALQGIAMGLTSILLYLFTPDCLEYGTYHTGKRSEGIAVSVQTFFVKLTGSLSGPLAMLIIGFYGFIEGDVGFQPETALHGIWLCMTLFPAIGLIFAITVWSRYKLRDKDVQVMAEYNSGNISKDEAEAKLSEKFGPAALLDKMSVTSVK